MESLKEAQVSKDIARLKSEEARDLGVQDFFNSRDKSNRKTKGKGSDTDMDVDFSKDQTVLAVGPHAQQVLPGMEVVLNMDNFKKRLETTVAQKLGKEFEFILPIEIINGAEYLYVSERDVKYISNNKK